MVGPTISVQTSCTEFDAVSGFRLLVLRRTGLPVPVDIVHEVPALTSSTVRARAHRRARRGRGGVARSDPLEPVVALPGHADGGPRAAVHVPGRGAHVAASGLGVPPCYPDVCSVRQCKSKRHACPAKSRPHCDTASISRFLIGEKSIKRGYSWLNFLLHVRNGRKVLTKYILLGHFWATFLSFSHVNGKVFHE